MKAEKVTERSIATICLVIISIIFTIFGANTITLNLQEAETKIPHELFGVLMEKLGRQWDGQGAIFVGTNSSIENINGMRKDVIEGFKECGVGAAEWPGGCAANSYNWSVNKNPSNSVGVDRFIEFCKLTGAEPVIAGRPTSNYATSNEAFCKYILEDLDYPLKWFKVGNEVWGCGGNQTVNTYIPNYSASYARLKNLKNHANGKNLSIIAGNDIEGKWNWLPTMLNSIGETIDAVEYHDYIYYPNAISSSNPSTADYWTVMGAALKNDVLPNIDSHVLPVMNSYDPDKRIKVILDEWGDWLMDTGDNWMQKATLMDALSAAIHLNLFIERCDRISVACMAQGVSVIHSLMNINTSGQMVKTPTFFVFKMFKPHHANNAKFIPTTSNIEKVNNLPAITAAASLDDSNTVNLSFSNIDLNSSQSVTVTLDGDADEYIIKSAEIVTGNDFKSGNNFGQNEEIFIETLDESAYNINGKVLTADLPAKSIVMIRLIPSSTSLQHKIASQIRSDAFTVTADAKGTVRINSTCELNMPVKINLFTIDGKVIMNKTVDTFTRGMNSIAFESSKLSTGVYLVEITGSKINYTQRIAVRR